MEHPIDVPGPCQYGGCVAPATELACGRKPYECNYGNEKWTVPGHPEPGRYCEKHARMISDEQAPEYTTCCPNCGCRFGVN